MAPTKTIIFGPTGSIGSATALAAHSKGADIALAMRDTSKSIPHLTPEAENSGHYTRIQADLTSPSSILEAVTKTGAKRAFLYLIFGSHDNQRASIEALKKGGVEFVVFLSSGGVHDGALEDVPSSDIIAWSHAQVEINLRDVFGVKGYVAVRPKYFATNSLGWKSMFTTGEVRVLHPEAQWDWITPKDIGLVCGVLLVDGFEVVGGRNWVRLSGPQLISQNCAIETIGKALGKEIKVTGISEEEHLEVLMKFMHMPEMVAKNLVRVFNGRMAGDDGIYDEEGYVEEVGNVMKYGGKKPTTFEEWVAENKEAFMV